MAEPKTYPPTKAERRNFYNGLNNHNRSKSNAGNYDAKQMGNKGSPTKLRDNGCGDMHRLSRPPSSEKVYVWAKAIWENSCCKNKHALNLTEKENFYGYT